MRFIVTFGAIKGSDAHANDSTIRITLGDNVDSGRWLLRALDAIHARRLPIDGGASNRLDGCFHTSKYD